MERVKIISWGFILKRKPRPAEQSRNRIGSERNTKSNMKKSNKTMERYS